MRILILYHNACADGSFAAATVSLAFPMEEVHYVALDYVQPNDRDICMADGTPLHLLPEIELYDRIYFVDFSISEKQLAYLTKLFTDTKDRSPNNLFVFDHHNTRSIPEYHKQCELLNVAPSTSVTFASESSGVMVSYFGVLTQFSTSSPRTMAMIGNLIRMVQLVSDRDTWRRENKRAFAFYEGYAPEMYANKEEPGILFKAPPSTIAHARDIVMNGNLEEIIARGFERIEERDRTIEKMYDVNGKVFEANDIIPARHAIMSASRAIGSEAAQWIRDNKDVQLILIVRCAPNNAEPEKVFCSVRSDGTLTVNAKTVANSFGGDGHPGAAGCVIPRKTFETFYPEINPDYKQVQI